MHLAQARRSLVLLASLGLLPGCLIRTSDTSARDPREADASVAVEAGTDSGNDVGLALVPSRTGGHLLSTSRVAVLQPDARRVQARFESPHAEAEFERAMAERYARGDAVKRSSASSTVPLLWGSEDKAVLSENAFYNEQIALADLDRDGMVSDAEADAYAGASRKVAAR
jgi:hypothetical protein